MTPNIERCMNRLSQFFTQKSRKLHSAEMMTMLPEKWQKVIGQNGEYLVSYY